MSMLWQTNGHKTVSLTPGGSNTSQCPIKCQVVWEQETSWDRWSKLVDLKTWEFMLTQWSIIWQDVEMTSGLNILLVIATPGALSQVLQDLLTILIVSSTPTLLKLVKDQLMNFHQFLTVHLISIVKEDLVHGMIPSSLTMDGSLVSLI